MKCKYRSTQDLNVENTDNLILRGEQLKIVSNYENTLKVTKSHQYIHVTLYDCPFRFNRI